MGTRRRVPLRESRRPSCVAHDNTFDLAYTHHRPRRRISALSDLYLIQSFTGSSTTHLEPEPTAGSLTDCSPTAPGGREGLGRVGQGDPPPWGYEPLRAP